MWSLITVSLVQLALAAPLKQQILSAIQLTEGEYVLENKEQRKCSAGNVSWIEDTEDESMSLQIGPKIIISSIGKNPYSEVLDKNCKLKSQATFSANQIVSISEETCKGKKDSTKTIVDIKKDSIGYKVLRQEKNQKFILDYECRLTAAQSP